MASAQAPAGDRLMWPIQLGATPEAGADGFAEDAPTVTVHGNIVDATEGESQPEVAIGSGDARQTFQTFPIPKAPLTFLSDPARSPPYAAELEIRVAGRLWQPAAAFFDRPADAEIYIVRQGEDGAYVQFGDGINGAALPSGRNNVTAAYRIGAGAHGGLAAGAEPKPKGKLKPLTGVTMPGPATGGAEPEDMAGARVAAPGRMQSLGRLVGLADYVAEALAMPGVVKAGAVFGAEAERQHIALTVLTEDESPEAVAAVEAALRHADRCRGPARYPLEVIGGRRRFVHISLTAGYDPAYRSGDLDAAIIAALGALPAIDGNPAQRRALRACRTQLRAGRPHLPGRRRRPIRRGCRLGQARRLRQARRRRNPRRHRRAEEARSRRAPDRRPVGSPRALGAAPDAVGHQRHQRRGVPRMTRAPLFERLPAIYRTRDADLSRQGQFEAYIGLMDELFAAIDDHIEAFYHDHFVETCDDWMVPYIGDLLGVTHLKGDPWTIRADTARTVALRRRRGTLGAMEIARLQPYRLGRPCGGDARADDMEPASEPSAPRRRRRAAPVAAAPHRGPGEHGTVTLRDPGVLSFLGGAFDGFARTADLKPTGGIHPRPNLPNLAIFLWRLRDFLVPVARPVHVATNPLGGAPGQAAFAARYAIHPLGRPVRLFNTFRYDPGAEPPELSVPDRTPGPMPAARLQDGPPTGNAAEYVAIDIYDGSRPDDPGDGAVGLTLHLPAAAFAGTAWTTRGANLCAWEDGLATPLAEREIVIDPVRGRLLLGIETTPPRARRCATACGCPTPTPPPARPARIPSRGPSPARSGPAWPRRKSAS